MSNCYRLTESIKINILLIQENFDNYVDKRDSAFSVSDDFFDFVICFTKKEGRLNVKPKSFAKATEEDKAKKRKPKEVPAAFRGQKIDLTDFTIVYVSLKGKKF